jgi:hypothetical protein
MANRITGVTKKELLQALKKRYKSSSKKDKTRILDEFTAITGFHRKHSVRLLSMRVKHNIEPAKHHRKIYNEAVRQALIVCWEAADRICGKRLKVILPEIVSAMKRHGHLQLNPEVRKLLLKASAATIDRLLASTRATAQPRKKRRMAANRIQSVVPIRTFADWNDPSPGFCEIDFVEHNGGLTSGSFLRSFVITDVCSGWTECVALLARQQSLVVEALKELRHRFPVPILGIDSDNDSAFMNDTLFDYCKDNNIEFTRSRPYRKNDQAWIEQKNGAVVRRFAGYKRFSGVVAGQSMALLYDLVRRYVNFFQPSFKLREKTREGGKTRKIYFKPATPCDRLLAHPDVSEDAKEKLMMHRKKLDPIDLLHRIRDSQSVLAALASSKNTIKGPDRKTLEQFLSQLPQLWRQGEVRATHRKALKSPRAWRTRIDHFESDWPEILVWLQNDPDVTAKSLFERLQLEKPGVFSPGQLRTLQRRVKAWRHIMAKELIYSSIDTGESE